MSDLTKWFLKRRGGWLKCLIAVRKWIRRASGKSTMFLKFIGLWWLFSWIKRHQRLSSYVTAITALISLHFTEKENKVLRNERNSANIRSAFLDAKVDGQTTQIDKIDLALYKVLKVDTVFKVVDLNKGYTRTLGIRRRDALGYSAFDLVPFKDAVVYNTVNDRLVELWKPKDTIEPFTFPNGMKIDLYTHKNPETERGDTVIYGYSIPLLRLLKVIDEHPMYEVIEIVSDSVPDAIQDTVVKREK